MKNAVGMILARMAATVSAQTNPTGPTSDSRRVNRGGSWNDYAWHCRVSTRSGYTPDHRRIYNGLRLAL